MKVIKTSLRTWKVISDNENEYLIWRDSDTAEYKCTCPYYTRRRMRCKHVREVLRSEV